MLTAEYGGTGGKPIEGGLVVEEPDIEIGAGVSSKGKGLQVELQAPYSYPHRSHLSAHANGQVRSARPQI